MTATTTVAISGTQRRRKCIRIRIGTLLACHSPEMDLLALGAATHAAHHENCRRHRLPTDSRQPRLGACISHAGQGPQQPHRAGTGIARRIFGAAVRADTDCKSPGVDTPDRHQLLIRRSDHPSMTKHHPLRPPVKKPHCSAAFLSSDGGLTSNTR